MLEIQDAYGKAVRHFSSTDKPESPPQNVPIAPRWFPPPQQLGTAAGMHRFIWDLRYGRTGEHVPGDNDDADEEHWTGPFVLPGIYIVKLNVNGETLKQPLRVTMDPRSRATASELAAQFRWAQRAFDDMVTARIALAEIKGLQTKLEQVKSQAGAQPLAREIDRASNGVQRIVKGSDPSDDNGLEAASHGLTVALRSIESADRTPPSQVIALYREASTKANAAIKKWNAFKQSVLPALNQALRSAGLGAIQISRIEEEAQESLSR
jgi:hypothetical protein